MAPDPGGVGASLARQSLRVDSRAGSGLVAVLAVWMLLGVAVLGHSPVLVGLSFATAVLLSIALRSWPIVLVAGFLAMLGAQLVIPSPYDSPYAFIGINILAAAVGVYASLWALSSAVLGRPDRHLYSPLPDQPLPHRLLAILLIVGVLGNVMVYGLDWPLFADSVDASRAAGREASSMVTGFMRESLTLGLMISAAQLGLRSTQRAGLLVWVLAFVVGALGGGSRNSLLIALVPAGLTVIGIQARAGRARALNRGTIRAVKRPSKRRIGAYVGTAVALLGGLVGAFYFAGQRVLSGQGAFERAFQAQHEGNPFGAAIGAADLSLSAPIETFSRMASAQSGGQGELFVLQSVRFLLAPFGIEPDLYATTLQFSYPYYMNVATFFAAPYLDFGLAGALVLVAAIGAGVGMVDGRFRGRGGFYAQLLRNYWIYIGIFALYEFLPFIYLAWLPVTLVLLALHRREKA